VGVLVPLPLIPSRQGRGKWLAGRLNPTPLSILFELANLSLGKVQPMIISLEPSFELKVQSGSIPKTHHLYISTKNPPPFETVRGIFQRLLVYS